MKTLHGPMLGSAVRTLSDSAQSRVLIVSPYIGRWPAVASLLGAKWWQGSLLPLRVITDVSVTSNVNLGTLRRLADRGTVKSLPGVHAKLYIFDDLAIVTSANLTETAFTKRREVGLLLDANEAQDVIDLFASWWEHDCHEIAQDKFTAWERPGSPNETEQEGIPLPVLWGLPDAPEDSSFQASGARGDAFSRYQRFLKSYDELAGRYKSVQRLWPKSPLYLEVDSFLNFLFHDADGKPSKEFYYTSRPRELTDVQRTAEISKWARRFAKSIESGSAEAWYKRNVETVRRLLNRESINSLSREGVREVAGCINAMNHRLNKFKFLNPKNNTIAEIRKSWRHLLHGGGTEATRIAQCNSDLKLYSFGTSSIQELLGWYYPEKYPLKNGNSDAGMLFFGFRV